MTDRIDDDQRQKSPPCQRCVLIRFFLMAVVGTALLYGISPGTFGLIKGFSTLTLAILFIGVLCLLATGKVALELIKAERRLEPDRK